MSSANVRIVDLKTAPASPQLLKEIEAIFFAASGRSFDLGAERDAFHERWLGRYLWTATDVALVAVEGGNTAGYLVGCFEDPALQERFGDISYFRESFSALTKRYPAHLHINLASRYRSQGIGARLIEAFAVRATAAGTRGMHVVTGQGMRTVSFYLRCGFAERATAMWNGRPIVFLARNLEADAP
jgi:GNAT superfamily N-acetyltransferase